MSSPYNMPQTTSSPDERVTTEPQRQALDAMSQELVNKLNIMVAEQEQRAREFAARQHSLSSLPQQTLPPVPSEPVPSSAIPSATPSSNIYTPESAAGVFQAPGQVRSAPLPGGVARGNSPAPGRTAPPPQPSMRHPLTGLTRPPDRREFDSEDDSDFPPSGGSFPPSGQEEGKGLNINAGTLIVILLVGLALLRSCGS